MVNIIWIAVQSTKFCQWLIVHSNIKESGRRRYYYCKVVYVKIGETLAIELG